MYKSLTRKISSVLFGSLAPLLVFCVISAAPTEAFARESSKAVVVDVIDADFLLVRHASGVEEKLWILGLIPPGPKHHKMPDGIYKEDAIERGRELLQGKEVYLKIYKAIENKDEYYKRRVRRAHVYLPDGRSYATVMVREGFAWASFSGPMSDEMRNQLRSARQDAKENVRGVYTNEQVKHPIVIASKDVVRGFGYIVYIAACITVSSYSGVNACQ